MSEIDKADVLIEALGVAAFTFETYEKLHSAKRTPEGYDKARKNAQMAARCLDAISAYRQASPHPIARAGLDVGRAADPYAHADGSRECRPAAGKWSRPDAEARARELLAEEFEQGDWPSMPWTVRNVETQKLAPIVQVALRAIAKAIAPAELNENGWHLPSVNEGLRIARECNAPEIRRQVIEECAAVAEQFNGATHKRIADVHDIAAAIRQLEGEGNE